MLHRVIDMGVLCTLTLCDVESNFSINCGNTCAAKYLVDAIHSLNRNFRSCAVIPYGSSGGGRKVIGK